MKTKIKKILLIGPFPDPISGVSLANKVVNESLLENKNYKTSIINTSFSSFDEKIGAFSIKKLFFFLNINLQLFKVFTSNKVYITPGQTFYGISKYTLFILLSYTLKKELIIHIHGNHLETEFLSLKGLKKKYFEFLIPRFSKGIVLSKSLRGNLSRFLDSDDIYELSNFAEEYLLSDFKTKSNKKLRLVFLSNLMREKGIYVFIKALQKLEQQNIDYEAKIAGNIDNSNLKELEQLFTTLKKTQYIGVVNGLEKKRLLEWSTVFVLPTFYKMEGQPISILEALATGNVIITTRHAGITDVIEENKHGFFVEKQSVEDLVKKIILLIKSEDKIVEISKNNKTYFINNFTVQKFKTKLVEILEA